MRFTQGNLADFPAAARELVQHGVDLLFTSGVTATKAAQRVTQTTPIVFTSVDDPVAFGLVQSYLGIEVVELALRTQVEAQEVLTRSQDPTVQGLLSPRHLYLNIPGFVLQATSEQAIPTMFNDAFYVERGGLASYGPSFYESGQLAARLVDKILKGTKPSESPVEVNNNIKFVINLKVANQLG